MWDASAVEPARLGFVVNFPEVRAPDDTIIEHERWLHSEFVVGRDVLAQLEDREQYITQLELLAAVAVYSSLDANDLRGRDVLHWIDNTGALGILAKTYSPDFDCARIVHAMELMQLDLAFVPFFEYVRSEANIADLPSRGESQWVVDEFQSEYITTVIPSLDGWLGEARAKRMRTSRGSKRKASGQE